MSTKDRTRDYAAGVGIAVCLSMFLLLWTLAPGISDWLTSMIGGIVGLSASFVVLHVLKARQKRI
jgi:putative flippase GtrA